MNHFGVLVMDVPLQNNGIPMKWKMSLDFAL